MLSENGFRTVSHSMKTSFVKKKQMAIKKFDVKSQLWTCGGTKRNRRAKVNKAR